jgi:CMP-N-acetylneuraminate monooxygenase
MENLLVNKFTNKYIQKAKEFTLQKSTLTMGTNNFEEFIVHKSNSGFTVFDRKCDHAGGKLISTYKNKVICPMHKWELNPATSSYQNNIKKEPIEIAENDKEISFNLNEEELTLPNFQNDKEIIIKFLNHACLIFESENLKFATDPWIVGSAFNNGWWLKYKSPENAFEELNTCDFIFISHTHPDHLHEESLSKIRKDMLMYTTNFESKSSEEHLKSLGFKNIKIIEHDIGYIDEINEFYFSPLKSGDFRDDSGFIFKYGTFSCLINVDSNFINFYKLPKDLTLVASTFASGASGFPLCFENIKENEKNNILRVNRISTKKINKNLITRTGTSYFLPYAGFFEESAIRDSYIKENNSKNKIEDYSFLQIDNDVTVLSVEFFQEFTFNGTKLQNKKGEPLILNSNLDTTSSIINFKDEYDHLKNDDVVEYFTSANFNQNFNLLINLTDDFFNMTKQIGIIFYKDIKPDIQFPDNMRLEDFNNENNSLHLHIREEAFINTLLNLMPWEDLLIGFQVRVDRKPNVYNTDFWYHFSNIYTKYNALRIAKDCNGCDSLKFSLLSNS